MFQHELNEEPFLRLRKEHQQLADELGMNQEEYLVYRGEIDNAELKRMGEEATPLNPLDFVSGVNLLDNKENLGYSRHFITREDAEFLMEKILKWEKDNEYLEAIDEHIFRDLNQEIDTYIATGVKYDFKMIDLSLYSIFGFQQVNYEDRSTMLHRNHLYVYNHRTKEFAEVTNDDFLPISL